MHVPIFIFYSHLNDSKRIVFESLNVFNSVKFFLLSTHNGLISSKVCGVIFGDSRFYPPGFADVSIVQLTPELDEHMRMLLQSFLSILLCWYQSLFPVIILLFIQTVGNSFIGEQFYSFTLL